MRELERLIERINNIIEGYLFSGRFGDSRFDITNAAHFSRYMSESQRIVDKTETAEAAADAQPKGIIQSITETAYSSSTYIYSWLESGFRTLTKNPKTLHRFPTIEWLYAIRFKLMQFKLTFLNIQSSLELHAFQDNLFNLIDDLFSTVELLMKTPADDSKPIKRVINEKEFCLVGLQDNDSELGKLFNKKLLKKTNLKEYRTQIIEALAEDISNRDDVICASKREEKSARDMRGVVSVWEDRVSQLTRDLELNRHLVEVRTNQISESDARWDRLQKDLTAKDQERAKLQTLIDKLGREKARVSKELAETRREEKEISLLETKMRELEDELLRTRQHAVTAAAQVDALTTDLAEERAEQVKLKGQLDAIEEQTKVVEQQLQQNDVPAVESEQPVQLLQPLLSASEQRKLFEALNNANQSHELDNLGKTLHSLKLLGDEDEEEEEAAADVASSAQPAAQDDTDAVLRLVVAGKLNEHMAAHLANAGRVESYPHMLVPDPKLNCTVAQYFVHNTRLHELDRALSANPNLLNAVCEGRIDELKTKSLIEIALFFTNSKLLKRKERLEVLIYLLERRPDISNTVLYETIKENLNNPKLSCNSDLKMEYCLYATAHKTCSGEALDEFYQKYLIIKRAKALLKRHQHVVLFHNKKISQLLAEMQSELYACKLLCDGYLHGHFDAFRNNTRDTMKDVFAGFNLIMLDAMGQKQSDKTYLKKHGRLHYQAELLSTLEPKYAACYVNTIGGAGHKFEDKHVELTAAETDNADETSKDIPKGMKMFNGVDASIEPLLAAYGELVKQMFLMISRYGVVLSANEGFNKYQIMLIERHLAAKMQAQLFNPDQAQDGDHNKSSFVIKM